MDFKRLIRGSGGVGCGGSGHQFHNPSISGTSRVAEPWDRGMGGLGPWLLNIAARCINRLIDSITSKLQQEVCWQPSATSSPTSPNCNCRAKQIRSGVFPQYSSAPVSFGTRHLVSTPTVILGRVAGRRSSGTWLQQHYFRLISHQQMSASWLPMTQVLHGARPSTQQHG